MYIVLGISWNQRVKVNLKTIALVDKNTEYPESSIKSLRTFSLTISREIYLDEILKVILGFFLLFIHLFIHFLPLVWVLMEKGKEGQSRLAYAWSQLPVPHDDPDVPKTAVRYKNSKTCPIMKCKLRRPAEGTHFYCLFFQVTLSIHTSIIYLVTTCGDSGANPSWSEWQSITGLTQTHHSHLHPTGNLLTSQINPYLHGFELLEET